MKIKMIISQFYIAPRGSFEHLLMQSLLLISICTYRPWAVGQNYFVSWHPSGKHLVYGLFERHIGILLPKKVSSQAKNLPDTEKTGDL